ncbi:unnamed protein product [Nyctereutes procyonoides]|uniref:(raccoon dog) hypothetical protein n=1 Tax=Nyctereutes procyonoides TaxID=34880 RepID=A0A811Z0K7_NYCPR|nr:unnamed protein product [Nyctereutes procyonoides]
MSLNPPIFLKEKEENNSKFVETQHSLTTPQLQKILFKIYAYTAIHAKLLAPEFLFFLIFFNLFMIVTQREREREREREEKIQNIKDKNDDPDKPSIKCKKTEEQDLNENKCQYTTLKKTIFIDRLLQIELKTRKTCFWHHQKRKSVTFLSITESIYSFLVDYHTDILKKKYQGQYDNLLFFYSFVYQLISYAKCSGETRKLTH